MKAMGIQRYGGPEEIGLFDLPEPVPGPGEVLLDVKAAALNHLDIWVRMGRPGDAVTMPHVLGSDAAGVILEVGPGVTTVGAGEKVILNPGYSCGHCEWCLRGEQTECPTFGIFGWNRSGVYAEHVVVPVTNVVPMPAHLSFEEAAALPLAHVTAWRMLMGRARMRPGETVLIHGIGGGVALAALQFVKHAMGEAIVTSSSEEKLARAQEMGADHTINYRTSKDVAAEVKDATGGRGADIIIDSVGAATWPINVAAARNGGQIVHCGVTTGSDTPASIAQIYGKQLSIHGSRMGSMDEFRSMAAAVAHGLITPVVDSVYPLAEARTATERMEAGQQFGKLVLSLAQ